MVESMTSTASPYTALSALFSDELLHPAPPEAHALVAEIRRRHGEAVDAVLFYGSCLRTQQMADAVLDFYVLVRSYRMAYTRPLFRWLNASLPPNVFYIEIPHESQTLRAKYAVISTLAFVRATTPRSVSAIIWARFCQPARLMYVRDAERKAGVVRAVSQAALTMVQRMIPLLVSTGSLVVFSAATFWQRAFRETYRTELRTERPETIQALYLADPERYDRVAVSSLRVLAQRGLLTLQETQGQWSVSLSRRQRWAGRSAWFARRPLAKALYAVRLLKTALTFHDWLPYDLWKLGRHTGVWVELTERQRRHPLIWGWPVVWKLLRRRALR